MIIWVRCGCFISEQPKGCRCHPGSGIDLKQETDRQISELRAYAKVKGYDVVEICRETISGTADGDDRHGLKRAEALAIEGKVKKVLVHEISRVARRNSVAHHFVEMLKDCGVSLYWHAQGIETLLPNGKRNPSSCRNAQAVKCDDEL